MPVEIFTKEEFEKALPLHRNKPLWREMGCIKGEYCYCVDFGSPYAEIFIRSSVHRNGLSAPKGEDSIRVWLISKETEFDSDGFREPLCRKLQRWVTRQLNWRTNLRKLLEEQAHLGMVIKECPQCGKPTRIFEIKKGSNAGKLATGCSERNGDVWENHCFDILPMEFQPKKVQDQVQLCPTCGVEMRVVSIKNGSNAGKQALTCPAKSANGTYLNHFFKVLD